MAPFLLKISLILVAVTNQATKVCCSRILLMPTPQKSHQLLFATIAEELIRRNHEVYVFFGHDFTVLDCLERLPIKWLKFHSDLDAGNKFQKAEMEFTKFALQSDTSFWSFTAKIGELYFTLCRAVVADDDILLKMERLDFDLVLVDNNFSFKCAFLVIHRLGIPHVSLMDYPEPWLLRLPWLPSFAPFKVLPYTEKMTFWERFLNTFTQIAWIWFPPVSDVPADLLEKYQQYGEFGSVEELQAQSLLYFLTSDYHLDYALPVMPFIINIPGPTIVPNKRLPPDLSAIVADSLDGVVLVSFGSSAANLPKELGMKMLSAFGHLNQTVFWRYTNIFNLTIPTNVYIMDWMPQNDLLAHPKVKVFVTHSGNNGQHEALYHGVPMVAMPLFGDQPYNAQRMVYKGFGVALNIKTFTSDELLNKIRLVIEDPSYMAAIRKASKIFRSRPYVSRERAAFWIEHVIEYGADHLHSYSQVMPWYQFLMLDIATFCLLLLIVVIFSTKKLLHLCSCVCCGKVKEKRE